MARFVLLSGAGTTWAVAPEAVSRIQKMEDGTAVVFFKEGASPERENRIAVDLPFDDVCALLEGNSGGSKN